MKTCLPRYTLSALQCAAVILFVGVLGPTVASSQTGVFKEPQFASLRWGMSASEFMKVYPRKVYTASQGYVQDPQLVLYGQPAFVGFDFGKNDHLRRIVGSFAFEIGGKELRSEDVVRKSLSIVTNVSRAYGRPDLSIPWDGKALVYMWVRSPHLIQIGWNGGDAWGLHYRSRAFDPDVPGIIDYLRSLGIKTND